MRDATDVRYWVRWAGAALRDRADQSDADALAETLAVSPRTVRHWISQNQAPAWAVRVLMQLVSGIPAFAGAQWDGWRFVRRNGRAELTGPDGSHWSPDDLIRYRDTQDHLRCLQERLSPGAQLTWRPAQSGQRTGWPGGERPSWLQLEDALRHAVADVMQRGY